MKKVQPTICVASFDLRNSMILTIAFLNLALTLPTYGNWILVKDSLNINAQESFGVKEPSCYVSSYLI